MDRVGSQYIVYTPSVFDLLLNAVALEIVISVDEILYAAMAPRRIQRMISNAAGVPLSPVRFRGVDVGACATALVVGALLTYFTVIEIVPQQRDFLSARDALCGGDLEFVTTTDGAGVPTWGYPNGIDETLVNPRNYPNGESPELASLDRAAESDPAAYGTMRTLTKVAPAKPRVPRHSRLVHRRLAVPGAPATARPQAG